MRPRLSYANVVSTLALVFALGTGGAYAAHQVNGKLLKNRSVTGKKVKRNTLGGTEIKESKLSTVPRASNAFKLGGRPASGYLTTGATAANAANAANAAALGGIGPGGFVRGSGTHTTGRDTASGGADPNVFKTFSTPVGEFRLGCGVASVDARYVNTTPGDADVFRFDHSTGTGVATLYNAVAPGDSAGFATNDAGGPAYVDIRAGKGSATAILRVGERRQGTNCIVDWEVVTSG
jgi:hypothetical protein